GSRACGRSRAARISASTTSSGSTSTTWRIGRSGWISQSSPRRFRLSSAAQAHTEQVKAPKILAVASAVDLDFRYGCTPAWWQLWKGLYEAGCDLIVTPYRGRPVDAPWWRTEPNPCYREAELFASARDAVARLKRDTHLRRAEDSPPDTRGDRFVREVIWRWVTPR